VSFETFNSRLNTCIKRNILVLRHLDEQAAKSIHSNTSEHA
jgi:hypothetical protein